MLYKGHDERKHNKSVTISIFQVVGIASQQPPKPCMNGKNPRGLRSAVRLVLYGNPNLTRQNAGTRVSRSLLPGLDGVAILACDDLDALCADHVVGFHLERRILDDEGPHVVA